MDAVAEGRGRIDLKQEIAGDYGVLNDDGYTLRETFLIDGLQNIRHISSNDLDVGGTFRSISGCCKPFSIARSTLKSFLLGGRKGRLPSNPYWISPNPVIIGVVSWLRNDSFYD